MYICYFVVQAEAQPSNFFIFEIGLCLDLSSLAKLFELKTENYTNPTINDVWYFTVFAVCECLCDVFSGY